MSASGYPSGFSGPPCRTSGAARFRELAAEREEKRAEFDQCDRELKQRQLDLVKEEVTRFGVTRAAVHLGLGASRVSELLKEAGVSGRALQRQRAAQEATARAERGQWEEVPTHRNLRKGQRTVPAWRTEPTEVAPVRVRRLVPANSDEADQDQPQCALDDACEQLHEQLRGVDPQRIRAAIGGAVSDLISLLEDGVSPVAAIDRAGLSPDALDWILPALEEWRAARMSVGDCV